jgi:AcrR family transcriptional regulator
MTDGFARRREQSKEDIRKAAWELFAQFGIEKVSIADISRKAGVSQATIYNNFGSKEGLVREFVTASIDQLMTQVQEVLSPSKSYWEKMADIIQFISATMAQGRLPGNSRADLAVFSSGRSLLDDPEIKKIRAEAEEKMTGLLLQLVQEGREQGHIRTDLPDEAFRVYFLAFMNIFIDPRFQQQYDKNPRLVQSLGSLMIYGMSGDRTY